MILKSLPLFLLLILLPDIYLYRVYVGRRGGAWTKVAWWAVCLLLLACTCLLALCEDFTPQPQRPLNIFLFVLGVFTIPKAVFSLFDACGRWWSRRRRSRRSRRFGRVLGLLAAAFIAFATFYGSTAGFNKFEVRHIDYWSDELPAGFDGYRIALFSDAHVGSFQYDSAPVLEAAIDSLNAMGADAIFVLGDIQNTRPEEIERKLPVLSRLHAPDGVFSILGNHDYSHYMGGTREEKMASEAKTMALERQMCGGCCSMSTPCCGMEATASSSPVWRATTGWARTMASPFGRKRSKASTRNYSPSCCSTIRSSGKNMSLPIPTCPSR